MVDNFSLVEGFNFSVVVSVGWWPMQAVETAAVGVVDCKQRSHPLRGLKVPVGNKKHHLPSHAQEGEQSNAMQIQNDCSR